MYYCGGPLFETLYLRKLTTLESHPAKQIKFMSWFRNLFKVIAILAFCATSSCGYAPAHEVRTKPEYIKADVKPGDKVEILTRQGAAVEFEVTDVELDALAGDGVRVSFGDIEKLTKRSWREHEHPCGGGLPVGCSIPSVVTAISSEYENQINKFKAACVLHDFCYRHGHATYGVSREQCDETFYENMKDACGPVGLLAILDAKDGASCRIAAKQNYEAVRRYGEEHYLTTTSSVCEYRE